MNPALKTSLIAGGSLFGFTLAYVAFALVLGAQPHAIPVVGAIFPAPPEAARSEPAVGASAPVEEGVGAPVRPQNASIGLLDVFQIDAPYSASELDALVEDLKHKSKDYDGRLVQLAERERHADERAQFLDEQYAELQRLRSGLEQWETELEQRQVEVESSETAHAEREQSSWVKLGKLFSEGDAAEQGARLSEYSPEDAARILQTVKPARAKELLDNVGAAKWKEYAEAFRKAEDPNAH